MHDDSRVDYLGWSHFHCTDLVNDIVMRSYIADPNRAIHRLSNFQIWSVNWPFLHRSKRAAIDSAVAQVYHRLESLNLALERAKECPDYSENKVVLQEKIELCTRLIESLKGLLIATPARDY
jgi:hypothetical protein